MHNFNEIDIIKTDLLILNYINKKDHDDIRKAKRACEILGLIKNLKDMGLEIENLWLYEQ